MITLDRRTVEKVEALLNEALGLLATEKDSAEEPMLPSGRVEKVGKVAHLHLEYMEHHGGAMTLGESRALRKQHYGEDVRSTANLFGRKGSGAILYRQVDFRTRLHDSQVVLLTEEGMQLALAYRKAHHIGAGARSRKQ
jgi:hypothetical protein